MKRYLTSFVAALTLAALASHTKAQNWEVPTPAATALVAGDTLYLYNTIYKGFFLGANDYSTRASVGEKGYKVVATQHVDAETQEWDGKTYVITNFVETAGKMMQLHRKANGTWVDNGAAGIQPDTLFAITRQANGSYLIAESELNPTFNDEEKVMYVLISEGSTDTRLYFESLQYSNEYAFMAAEWTFVSKEEYARYLYNVRAKAEADALLALINQAKDLGVATAEGEAAYANTSNSPEVLAAVAERLQEAINTALAGGATPDNPADFSSLIDDPGYLSASRGWSGTAPAVSNSCAEFFNKDFNYYRTVKNLEPGIYVLSVQGFYRYGTYGNDYLYGAANRKVLLYAESNGDTFSTPLVNLCSEAQSSAIGSGNVIVGDNLYVPNGMASGHAFFEADHYHNNLYFKVQERGDVTIGLKKEEHTETEWTLFSNWQLQYIGQSADAYTLWRDQSLAPYQQIIGQEYSYTLYDEYEAALQAAMTATDSKSIQDAIDRVAEAYRLLTENIAAYEDLNKAFEEALSLAYEQGHSGEAIEALKEIIDEVEDLKDEHAASTEEIRALTERVAEATQYAFEHSITKDTDITAMIVNADFRQGNDGWTSKISTPGGNTSNTPAVREVWNANFDFYQELTGLPNGLYELRMNACYRTGTNAVADSEWANGTAEVLSYLYANDNEVAVKNIMAEAREEAYTSQDYTTSEGLHTPDGVNSASAAFAEKRYENVVYGTVTDGTLRIGIRNITGSAQARWTIWGNAKLIYRADDPQLTANTLFERIESAIELLQSDAPVAPTAKEDLSQAIDEANNAIDSWNADSMNAALQSLNEAIKDLLASQALYEDLKQAHEALEEVLVNYEATDEDGTQGAELAQQAYDAQEDASLENDEVQALIDNIYAIIVRIKVNPRGTPSEASPIDYTAAIVNPGYEENNKEGWENIGTVNHTAFEFWNTNYDLHQTIFGLPDGTYRLSLHAYYRAGGVESEVERYTADPEADLNALLYAATAADEYTTPIKRLCSETAESLEGATNEYAYGDGYVPNDFQTASRYFLERGAYLNQLTFPLTGGKLTIGVKKTTLISADWIAATGWKLELVSGDPDGITTVANSTSINGKCYDLSGREIVNGQLSRGLYIIGGKKVIAK